MMPSHGLTLAKTEQEIDNLKLRRRNNGLDSSNPLRTEVSELSTSVQDHIVNEGTDRDDVFKSSVLAWYGCKEIAGNFEESQQAA